MQIHINEFIKFSNLCKKFIQIFLIEKLTAIVQIVLLQHIA